MTHPADVQSILRQAAILVGKAEALGVTLRITGVPMKPLAMGNQRTVIDAWPARILPVGRQGAATPEHHERMAIDRRKATEKMSDREWAAMPSNLREGCTTHVDGVGDI